MDGSETVVRHRYVGDSMTNSISHLEKVESNSSELLINSIPDNMIPSNKHIDSQQNESSKKDGKLRRKVFVPRESLLTELLAANHIRTVYHICVTMLFIICMRFVVISLLGDESTSHLGLVHYVFGQLWFCLKLLFIMHFSVMFLVYSVYHFWAHHRSMFANIFGTGNFVYVFDWLFTSLLSVYTLVFIIMPPYYVMTYNFPPATSFMLLMEQVRLFMKIYAFLRTNIPSSISTDKQSQKCPDFSSYIYFLFAPTLVYRDMYPRTDKVRWRVVFGHLLQFCFTIVCSYCMLGSLILPVVSHFDNAQSSLAQSCVGILSVAVPAMVCHLCGFYGLLHSWLNAWAELTCFADRQFYHDWWNSTNFSTYCRTWNIVVHDWLYEYIYLDLARYKHKTWAAISVFAVSSLVHEYILALSFKFFFPVLLMQFGLFGTIYYFLNTKTKFGNIMLWFNITIGLGMDHYFYGREWYSRNICAKESNSLFDFFILKVLSCK